MFRGFDIQLPSYAVICPQTGFSFNTRSLTVAEVGKLKGSLMTPAKAPGLINQILWESLAEKPDFIKTIKDFKRLVTMRDREALLYGCYHATFGDKNEYLAGCSSCNKSETLKLSLSKIFSMEPYPGSESLQKSYKIAKSADSDTPRSEDIEKNIALQTALNEDANQDKKPGDSVAKDAPDEKDGISLGSKPEVETVETVEAIESNKLDDIVVEEEKEVPSNSILRKLLKVDLPISKLAVFIKQPTIADEEKIMSEMSYSTKKNVDLIQETLVIDRMEQYNEAGDVVQTALEREDILEGYQQLPPRDKEKIFEVFLEEFGKYGISLEAKYNCSNCGEQNEIELDIVIQFFRMVGLS